MDLKLNADRFSGKDYVNLYDKFRPTPPKEILHQTLNYLNKAKAEMVVDLGCGTGLSTEIWSSIAKRIIGIEPSKEMVSLAAKKNNKPANVEYLAGFANEIPLPNHTADIITCSQSFHWMEPESTLKDINRVLKPNGVLVIYDAMWPPFVNQEYELAYIDLFRKVNEIIANLEEVIAHRWDKDQHLKNVQESAYFSLVREGYYHKTVALNQEEFVGIAMSQGGLEALLKRGFTESAIGVTKFKERIKTLSRKSKLPVSEMTYCYRVVFALRP